LWFVVTLASLAILVILILCIPVELVLRANTEERTKFRLSLIWFFGLFNRDLRPSPRKSSEDKVTKGKSGSWLQRTKFALEILRTRGLLRQLGRFIKRTFKNMKVRELAANLKVDLENPADTGLIFSVLAPANLLANYFFPYPVKIEPSFAGESFITGYFNARIKLMPIQVMASATGFVFSVPSFRAMKKLVVYKWKRKK
jgi:hypothetical protein